MSTPWRRAVDQLPAHTRGARNTVQGGRQHDCAIWHLARIIQSLQQGVSVHVSVSVHDAAAASPHRLGPHASSTGSPAKDAQNGLTRHATAENETAAPAEASATIPGTGDPTAVFTAQPLRRSRYDALPHYTNALPP